MMQKRTGLKNLSPRPILGCVAIASLFFSAHTASAQVIINEIQIAPTNGRFIELYNPDNSDIDLTGWYIQRKTATGSSFGSLVTSTQLTGKTIRAHNYLLISRSQLGNSDIVVGDITLTESNTIRVRDSKGKDSDQVGWGSIAADKSYQRTSLSEWLVGAPTPGAVNAGTTNVSTQSLNVSASQPASAAQLSATPQITAQADPQTRVVLAGASIIFERKITGLENTYGSATRTTWSFGDGARAEGDSVSHTYYYPGEYTAVLDVVSGGLTATDKMLVRVVLPNLILLTGGDTAHSFFTTKNAGGDELDISGWQVASDNKTFTFPKNTILGARKSATFASEITGLATPTGSVPELRFSNGSHVDIKAEIKTTSVAPQVLAPKVTVANQDPALRTRAQGRALVSDQKPIQTPQNQQASVVNALPAQKEGSLWAWYIGAAFLGALALLGIRLTKSAEQKASITADDFEIVEDEEPH